MGSALVPEEGDVGSEEAALGRNCCMDSSLCARGAQWRQGMVPLGPLTKSQAGL